jgi:hypothetical protein
MFGTGMPALLVAAGFAAAGAVSLWRRHPLAVALLVMPGPVTVVSFAILGLPVRPRFVFFLSGAAAIFVGRGIGAVAATLVRSRATRGGTERHQEEPSRPAAPETRATMVLAAALIALSATALPRNYQLPKQDFDGAVRFLESAEAEGARIAALFPSCWLFENYYEKAWSCLNTFEEWRTATAGPGRTLVIHTLAEYIEDVPLLDSLRSCPVVRRFPGTLGGGDVIVCEPQQTPARAALP